MLTKLRKLGPVTEGQVRRAQGLGVPGFVAAEVRGHGSTIDQEAAGFLVQAVGQDLRSLAAAAGQLTNDFGQPLTVEKVKQYFGGRARRSRSRSPTRRSGAPEVALEELRWALDAGTPAVLVTSAFAGGARGWPA